MKDEKIVYEFPRIQEITCDVFAGFDFDDENPEHTPDQGDDELG